MALADANPTWRRVLDIVVWPADNPSEGLKYLRAAAEQFRQVETRPPSP